MSRARTSAGILALRRLAGDLEFFLVHPGGPIYARRDTGWWTIPKGLIDEGESELEAARRELGEETGFEVPAGPYAGLGAVTQKSGKRVLAWAVVADFNAPALKSNLFEIEWPPRSGERQSFEEVDRGDWFDLEAARAKIMVAQRPFLERARDPQVLATLGLER